MKQKVAKEVQKIFINVAVNSIGRSAPIGIHEKRVPEVVRDQAFKTRESRDK